jgi:hypothetical protein
MKKQFLFIYKSITHHFLIRLIASISIAVGCVLRYSQNQFDVYRVSNLIYIPLIFIPIYILVSILLEQLVLPAWKKQSINQKTTLLFLTSLLVLIVGFLFPAPIPDFTQYHELTIKVTVDNKKTNIAELGMSYLNLSKVPQESIQTTPDWGIDKDVYWTNGDPNSQIIIKGNMPGGLLLWVHNQPQGGMLTFTWDGKTNYIYTNAFKEQLLPLTFANDNPLSLPPDQALFTMTLLFFYYAGIAIFSWGSLCIAVFIFGKRAETILFWGMLVGITFIFVYFKRLYLNSDSPHPMGDSLSYVVTSAFPLTSINFWAGIRSFTLPLFLKLLGIHQMEDGVFFGVDRLAQFQTYFSAFSWIVLGLSLLGVVKKRWLGLVLFGLVTVFSLSIPVSMWDALLLSESLTFSFFVLMISGWLWLSFVGNFKHPWQCWGLVIYNGVITVLYSFCRDSNNYYVLLAACVLCLGWIIDKQLSRYKRFILTYGLAVLIIFVLQYFTLSAGNRWQAFIYDQLSLRILKDPQATRYFANKGLPVSDNLKKITSMRGIDYRPLLDTSPEFKPVKDWVICCSKQTFIEYLLSNPGYTFVEPLQNMPLMMSGTIANYRNPRNGVTPLPQKTSTVSALFFNREDESVLTLSIISLIGIVYYLVGRRHKIWLVIAAITLPIIPMMYLIYLAEPMEIERHAVQLAVQLRLVGWISGFLLLADGIACIFNHYFHHVGARNWVKGAEMQAVIDSPKES